MDIDGYRLTAASHVTADFTVPFFVKTDGVGWVGLDAWRIIPGLGYVVRIAPIRQFIRGITPFRGLTNHGY